MSQPKNPSSKPSPARSLRQRVLNRYTLTGALIVLLALGGYWGWQKINAKKNALNQYQVTAIERGDIEDLVTATGTVQPLEYVDVGAQVSGQLKKLHVEIGSVVKEGDLLAEIDPTVLRATVDARRAGLRNQIASKKNQEAQLALAEIQYTRQKNLFAEDATTRESLQTAETTLRSARAQIEAIQAQIEQTESSLRADEANLNYAKIYAPMSGTVVSVTARQGQTLNANQSAPTILRVADLSTMTVQTQVSEAEVGKLRKDMEVYFTTLGSQGRRWYGKLRKLEPTPTVTNNVVLYNALFDVPNRNQALLPNMTTQVFFIASSAKDALLVPTAAVTLTRGGSRAAGAAGTGTVGASAGNNFANMTPEQRRAAFEKMSPEERAAMRERRQRERGEGNGSGTEKGAAPAAATAAPAVDDKTAGAASEDAQPDSSGLPGANQQAQNKTGTVRVVDGDNNIETRTIELGVTTRVQMQVLSGLKEGDRVITGFKQAQQDSSRPSGVAGMPPGMGGTPMRSR
ncbi:efflux RND transporter periplasmic adaptor subunit [Oxalicibacterium flavum]|uniref:efflux RND transporter periplasmic adaptor subunit n=1 Tax=Oxalicibacterium flavum TaxID=179467 RepID=UPI00166C96F0|nr:efflux RND transporter periplasmic adaptor subunit [Oxalicibacterium flavum]